MLAHTDQYLLTYSYCSHDWGDNDRQGDAACYGQVPLVLGDVFAFVAVVDLEGRKGEQLRA